MARAFSGLVGDAALRLTQLELFEQLLEAVAVLGEIDGVGRGAEDRHIRRLQRFRKLQRRLAAELHDDAVKLPLPRSVSMISTTSSAVSGSK